MHALKMKTKESNYFLLKIVSFLIQYILLTLPPLLLLPVPLLLSSPFCPRIEKSRHVEKASIQTQAHRFSTLSSYSYV